MITFAEINQEIYGLYFFDLGYSDCRIAVSQRQKWRKTDGEYVWYQN